jgi:hypothetical protein
MYNVGGQIGGDSDLSPQGWKYAQALPALIKENIGEDANLEVSFLAPRISSIDDKAGLDIYFTTNHADRLILELPQKDVEIAR